MKIKIKVQNDDICLPKIIKQGEWIDLQSAEDVKINAPSVEILTDKNGREKNKIIFENKLIKLGICVSLPKGFEAVIVPRSSTYNKTKTILSNSMGVIDNSYCGNNDEWKYNAIALNTCHIKKGDRIAQFRIQLSQKATFWQKLRWLFSNRIRLVQVDHLDENDRGGFGSTDKQEQK